MENPSQPISPHRLQEAYESLTQVLRAAVEQLNENVGFRDASVEFYRVSEVYRVIESFVDELYRVPGAEDELLRRSSFIEQSCGPNTRYYRAKRQALKSNGGQRTPFDVTRAIDALHSLAANPTFLGQLSEERTRLERVLAKEDADLSDKAVGAFEQWLCQCREIQREGERLEVDGCFCLAFIHRAKQSKSDWPPLASPIWRPSGLDVPQLESVPAAAKSMVAVARAIIEGGDIGGANLDSMLAAVESLAAWVRDNQAVLPSETTGPESSADHVDTKPPGKKKKRGPRLRTDPKADKKISEQWETRKYDTYYDLADELKISKSEVKKAIDRHRHRPKKRRNNSGS